MIHCLRISPKLQHVLLLTYLTRRFKLNASLFLYTTRNASENLPLGKVRYVSGTTGSQRHGHELIGDGAQQRKIYLYIYLMSEMPIICNSYTLGPKEFFR